MKKGQKEKRKVSKKLIAQCPGVFYPPDSPIHAIHCYGIPEFVFYF